MQVFTVHKPVGSKDHEFEAYRALLEEIGVDLSNAPRVQEPGTDRRWLYAWRDRAAAERFARELGRRTRDNSWEVRGFEVPEAEFGPLAPLDVVAEPVATGTVYRLSSESQERIMRKFPGARLRGEVLLPGRPRPDPAQEQEYFWDDVIVPLCGLARDQVAELGGFRVFETVRRTLYESAGAGA